MRDFQNYDYTTVDMFSYINASLFPCHDVQDEILYLFQKMDIEDQETPIDQDFLLRLNKLSISYPSYAELRLLKFYRSRMFSSDKITNTFFMSPTCAEAKLLKEIINGCYVSIDNVAFQLHYCVTTKDKLLSAAEDIFYGFLKILFKKNLDAIFQQQRNLLSDENFYSEIQDILESLMQRLNVFESIHLNQRKHDDFINFALNMDIEKIIKKYFSQEQATSHDLSRYLELKDPFIQNSDAFTTLDESKPESILVSLFKRIKALIDKLLERLLFPKLEDILKDTPYEFSRSMEQDLNLMLIKARAIVSQDSVLARELNQIIETKAKLKPLFQSESQYQLFIETRLYQYIKPFLNHIITCKMFPDNVKQAEQSFKKLNTLLQYKYDELIKQQNDISKIEFDVIDKEISSALKEAEAFQK